MVIELKEIIAYELGDFQLMEEWENDPDIKVYISPRRSTDPIPYMKAEALMAHAMSNPKKKVYFIVVDGIEVGVVSIIEDFPMLKSEAQETAWISIYIGHKNYLRKGIASKAMALLEETCVKLGYKRIELGVFGFNEKAQKLYGRLGYKKISELEKFVYYQDVWHSDIRMVKELTNAL